MKIENEREIKMLKFEIVKDVESNDVDGGCIVVRVEENINNVEFGEVVRNVVLGFDFGGSLCSVEIEDEDEFSFGDFSEILENVFSEECCEKLWSMDFDSCEEK